MAFTETQEVLASSLININMPHEWQISLILLLKDDEEAMVDLIKWIYYNEPTHQQVITKWLLDYLNWKNSKQGNNGRDT